MTPFWMKWMRHVDLDEPTSFLDHVFLECTQRECKTNETVMNENRKCSNHEFMQEQNPHAKTVTWSYDMEGHAQK